MSESLKPYDCPVLERVKQLLPAYQAGRKMWLSEILQPLNPTFSLFEMVALKMTSRSDVRVTSNGKPSCINVDLESNYQ